MPCSIEYWDLRVCFVILELEARVFLPEDEIKASRIIEGCKDILGIIRDEYGKEVKKISFYRRIFSPERGW